MKRSLAERFASHVDTAGPTPIACPDLGVCHMWTGARMKPGHRRLPYGTIKIDGRKRYAHVVSYELNHGPVPAGMKVLHACDTSGCVAPLHLSTGTLSENMRQAHARGRRVKRAA